jgi:hypothetical protein
VGDSHERMRLLHRAGTLVLAGATAGLMLGACGTAKGTASHATTTTTGSKSTTTTTTEPTRPTLPTETTIPFAVAQVQKGTGPATMADFKVPGNVKEWDLDWTYNCTATPTHTGSFAVKIVGHGSAANTTDAGVPAQTSPGTAGIVRNYDVGTFNLVVTTPCSWIVRIENIT